MPPIIPNINIKKKDTSDMAKAISLLTPAFAKNNIVIVSLNPRPPMDMGSKVIAPIMGIKIKK